MQSLWVKDLDLNLSDKKILMSGKYLSDKHMQAANLLLKKEFPHLQGLQTTLLSQTEEGFTHIHMRTELMQKVTEKIIYQSL